jgi:cyclic pyranopterin phosphate synthase
MPGEKLTHVDQKGRAKMVDVAEKSVTLRTAIAEATLHMRPATLRLILDGKAAKGDALAVARVAGIQAAKRAHELIPLCHQIPLSSVEVLLEPAGRGALRVTATVKCEAKTGVEMEALCAAAVAGLTLYDMVKAVDRGLEMTGVRLLHKSGGRSGEWNRPQTDQGSTKNTSKTSHTKR